MRETTILYSEMDYRTSIPFILTLFTSFLPEIVADENNGPDTSTKMITGIAAGFAFIIGLVVFIVTLWCCCCSKLSEQRRVMPSDFVNSTRSTSADSRRSSNASKT